MSAPIASAYGQRSPAGGQRQGATKRRSTIGCLVTLALLLVPLASEAQLPRTIPRIAYLALAPGPADAVSAARHSRTVSTNWGMSRARPSSWSTGGAQETSSGSGRMRLNSSGVGCTSLSPRGPSRHGLPKI
jgi:hypothetical protein